MQTWHGHLASAFALTLLSFGPTGSPALWSSSTDSPLGAQRRETLATSSAVPAPQLIANPQPALAFARDFPAFVADLEVGLNGRIGHGRVIVTADHRVYVESLPETHRALAIPHLTCLVGGPLDGAAPLGVAWAGPNAPGERPGDGSQFRPEDPLAVHYRLHNRQLLAAESRIHGRKLVLHVLGTSQEQHDPPLVFSVHVVNVRTQELERTATCSQTLKRVGASDLPSSVRVVSAGLNDREVLFLDLKLTNHRVLTPSLHTTAGK